MKLRNFEQTLENMRKHLATMDNDTFFAQLGTSIEELKRKATCQTQLDSSYNIAHGYPFSSFDDIAVPDAIDSFHPGMNFVGSLPYSNAQSHETSEIHYSNSSEVNNSISFIQAYAA
jgi:hypothetical protein